MEYARGESLVFGLITKDRCWSGWVQRVSNRNADSEVLHHRVKNFKVKFVSALLV